MTASNLNRPEATAAENSSCPSIKHTGNANSDIVREGDDLKPSWFENEIPTWGERLRVAEWEDAEYRTNNGWKGTDLIHSSTAPVQITDYRVSYGEGGGPGRDRERGGVGTILTGIARFTAGAESHKGYCHGGSMCSILDDVVGWCGFLVTGECRPWSGFTAQINASLKKPIAVGSVLRIRATITKWEGRKVYISAELADPGEKDLAIHATGEGLVILQREVLSEEGEEKKN